MFGWKVFFLSDCISADSSLEQVPGHKSVTADDQQSTELGRKQQEAVMEIMSALVILPPAEFVCPIHLSNCRVVCPSQSSKTAELSVLVPSSFEITASVCFYKSNKS